MPWIGSSGVVVSGVLTVLMMILCPVTCAKLGDIYWNSSNPIFRIDNTDHIIDVNKGNIPFEYDQVNIICPVYTPGTREEDVETYIIYNVSKEEYDSCRITNPGSRIIALCDKPHTVRYFTITFRSFTPQPGGLEFRPGQDYYFISTSGGAGEALDQRIGGKCATHNMKVIFKVCCDPAKTSSTSTTTITTTTTKTTTTPAPTSRPTSMMPARTTPKFYYRRPTTLSPFRFPPLITNKYPSLKSFDYPREEERGKVSSKKTEDRDKLPNETRAKNEELVNSKDSASMNYSSRNCIVLVALSLIYYIFSTR